jgi:hypothetical protein
MKTKQISLSEYAARVSPESFRKNRKHPEEPLTQQAIKYRIKMGMELPDVIEAKKIGKVHVLTVNANF